MVRQIYSTFHKRYYTELCKNIHAKFRESLSKCSHPIVALWHNITASHSQNLAGIFLHYSVCLYSRTFYYFQYAPVTNISFVEHVLPHKQECIPITSVINQNC